MLVDIKQADSGLHRSVPLNPSSHANPVRPNIQNAASFSQVLPHSPWCYKAEECRNVEVVVQIQEKKVYSFGVISLILRKIKIFNGNNS